MDNDIYDKIADYNDWVHLERPAGGVVEMKKLQGGKMKDEIKELKKEALEKLGEQENPEPWFSPQEVLDVIAEIEFLETEIKQKEEKWHCCSLDWNQELDKANKKIEELRRGENDWWKKRWVCNDTGQQLFEIRKKWLTAYECAENYQKMYEGKVKENKQLQAVRETAENFITHNWKYLLRIIDSFTNTEDLKKKLLALKQALTVKDKDEKIP